MLRKAILLIIISIFGLAGSISESRAEGETIDTVHTGIYITSIHDVDFKQKEYTIDFWLWLKYKNKEFDFLQNLEIPMAKSVIKSFSTMDSSNDNIYILMKIQCVMRDSWKIRNFPFDRQKLRLSIENSQFDSRSLVFTVDSFGKHFDPQFILNGWNIIRFNVMAGKKSYETNFGDPDVSIPHTEYSSFKVRVEIDRDAIGLFWKMFLGMYIAFLISYVSCYIHSDSMDARFGLSVGALFAVVGNKYIIDSSLPESITFTLVDTLHGITLLFILAVIAATVLSLKLVKHGNVKKARTLDLILGQLFLLTYVSLNIYFIMTAIKA